MVRKFCYRQRGRDFGPFTAEEMRTEAADGRIESDAIVWEYGTSTGVYARDVVGLFAPSNGSKGLRGGRPQPPRLPLVSDECIFRYVEFVFYKELLAIAEDRQLGVFTREEARERERALLAALQRIGEQLGQNTSHLPATDPGPFFGQIEGKYRDPQKARRAADDAAADQSETPLDAALLGVLAGSAAAMFLPWEEEHETPPSGAPDHDTVVEEEVIAMSKAESEGPRPEPRESKQRPEPEENPARSDESLDNNSDKDEADDDFGESFDGVSENWD